MNELKWNGKHTEYYLSESKKIIVESIYLNGFEYNYFAKEYIYFRNILVYEGEILK